MEWRWPDQFPCNGSFVLFEVLLVTQYGRSAARSTIGGGGQIGQCVREPGGACQDWSSSMHGWRSERWIGDEGGVG